MSRVSILIPSRNEKFLTKTIKDLLAKAAGEIEIIVNVDENYPEEGLVDGVTYLHPPKPIGMRPGINTCALAATGDWFLKLDGHCMLSEGFDVVLKENCDQDWIAVPSRYSLDPVNWAIEKNGKPRRDYHFLSSPIGGLMKRNDYTMHGVEWWARCKERLNKSEYDIDDEMSSQGSCWFISRRLWNQFGGMHVEGYGTFTNEFQELGLQAWLGGGRVIINKKAWYAHLHKGKQYGRMYHLDEAEKRRGQRYCATYWMNNKWEKRVHDFEWLIDKFWPVPDWPENWKELHAQGFGPDSIKK